MICEPGTQPSDSLTDCVPCEQVGNPSQSASLYSAAGTVCESCAPGKQPSIDRSLIVQQLLLLPCSSQSRDVTQDAVAICEATLALIHFAAPMVGLTESCAYVAQKLTDLLPTSHLTSQGYKQQELQEKAAYISLVQDDFAFAQRSEQCLRGLVCLHMSSQLLDRPHVQLGTGIFANRILQYGATEYAVHFPSRSADSVSRPCSRTLGQAEEKDDNILLQLIDLECQSHTRPG